MVTDSKTNDRGGATDVLVNYWLTKELFEDNRSMEAVPEYSLGNGAHQTLFNYFRHHDLPIDSDAQLAFELGIMLATAVLRTPTDAAIDVRRALRFTMDEMRCLREDAASG